MTTKQGLSESFQVSLELFQKHWKTIEKFESCPVRFKTKGFPRVFRISGQLLWSSGAPMLARCIASCGACISRRARKIESFFESRESSKHWGFEYPSLVPPHVGGGGRIRTSDSVL